MSDDSMMQGFPPAAADCVTVENWRTAHHSRWGFQHVCEIIPTASIPCDPSTTRSFYRRSVDLENVGYADGNWQKTVREMLDGLENDTFMVLHYGHVVCEDYGNGWCNYPLP